MKYKWICRCLTAVLLATFIIYSGATAFAQGTTTATVEGVITDQQNAVVPGVKVTIHNVSTGFERSTATDANGFRQRERQVLLVPVLAYGQPAGFHHRVARKRQIHLARRSIPVCPPGVPRLGPRTVIREPTPTNDPIKKGLKSSISGPFSGSWQP